MGRSIQKIAEELQVARGQLGVLRREADAARGALAAFARAVNPQTVALLDSLAAMYTQRLVGPGAAAFAGWGSPYWDTFEGSPTTQPVAEIRVGRLVERDRLPGEAEPDLPYLASLFAASGPLIFLCDRGSVRAARLALQNVVLRVALCMPGQVRFNLLDPIQLGSAFPYRGFLGDTVRPYGRTASDELVDVVANIRRINDRVIGPASRFSALTREQRAGELFEIVAAADFPKAYAKDTRAVEGLARVGTAGPHTGRHLILEWNVDEKPPHDFSREMFGENAVYIDCRDEAFQPDALPEGARQKALIEAAESAGQDPAVGDWYGVVRPEQFFGGDSTTRIETPVGERLKIWFGEQDNGRPSAHAMLAGQIGSGKSTLMHVLITGLASRYSPDELLLTLIDGKLGVEFDAYRDLPHADVVCLRTTPALARSVLADYVADMEDRYVRFQDAGVVKLSEYRARTGVRLPRRVMIVDEYQQLLAGDPESGAELLIRVLEKGRAAGTHVVLGSQTFEQRGLPNEATGHIHTWVALSLQEAYVQGLLLFGPEGKRLIRDLRNFGEVVINDEGGRDGANSPGAVARLRGPGVLTSIVGEIVTAADRPDSTVVLSGRDGALVSDNSHCMAWRGAPPSPEALQTVARRPVRSIGFGMENWNAADRPVPLWLGRRFDVRGHALAALRRAPGGNALVLGSHIDDRSRMLASSLAALATMTPPSGLEVTVVDGLRPDMPGSGMLAAALDQLTTQGYTARLLRDEEAPDALAALEASLALREPGSPSHLLVLAEPEYLYALHGGADRISAPKSGPAAALRTLLARGPQAGVHTVISASGLASFGLILTANRETGAFNHRIVQQMNEDESMSLFASLLAARIRERADHPFAAFYVDQIAGARSGVLFHGYCANRDTGGDQSLAALKRELAKLLP